MAEAGVLSRMIVKQGVIFFQDSSTLAGERGTVTRGPR
jgi:hypothetical protein